MNKDQQDLVWKCLPRETREELNRAYRYQCQNRDYNRGFNEALEEVFGHHNLTSDTEPSELLFVEREKVQEIYQANLIEQHSDSHIQVGVLYELFGDKCMPDKTLEEKAKEIVDTIKEDIENPIQVPETMLNPKVEPKRVSTDEVCKILGIEKDDSLVRKPYKESSVQVEPKFKKDEIVRSISTNKVLKIYANCADIEKSSCLCVCQDGSIEYFPIRDLKPYTEPETKENMEEKELNLVELLKGCEGEMIFSTFEGDMEIYKVTDSNIALHGHNTDLHCGDGFFPSGICQLFPSRALYEKYPLNPSKAWSEWAESRKPKIEITGVVHIYKNGILVGELDLPELRFKSIKEAQQAAEAVRECLMKFHEDNAAQ